MEPSSRSSREILSDVKRLAVEYYAATGRPLGVSGELAEVEAAEKLGLTLADARTAGYDAVRTIAGRPQKIQVKGRRVAPGKPRYRGRVPTINLDQPFDAVVLVLMGADYEAVEIREAPREAVVARLTAPGSKSRTERGSMGISQFRSIAVKTWPPHASVGEEESSYFAAGT
ncbi:MAG: hypothetical protein ACOZAA_01595 [Pseudomonadota bacterium]